MENYLSNAREEDFKELQKGLLGVAVEALGRRWDVGKRKRQ